MKPVLALLFAAAFWGFVWFPVRGLDEAGLTGVWQVGASYAAALLVLVLVRGLCLQGIFRQPLAVFWLVIASGWANVAFLLAVLQDEVVRVLIFFYLSPLWTVILGRWLLNEPIRGVTGWMLLLGLGGALTMMWHEDMLHVPIGDGDLLALSAGFAFALTNVMTRRLEHLGTSAKTQLAWIGVLFICALFILIGQVPMPAVAPSTWAGAATLGIAGFMFSTLAVVYAVSRLPVQRSSVIMLFEIVVGALSAWLLAGELVDQREWLGGTMIVLAGLIAVFFGQAEKERQHA